MKTITLVAGIALILNAGVGVYNFAMTFSRIGMRGGTPWMLSQGTWIIAQGCLIAFFFTLFLRQRE